MTRGSDTDTSCHLPGYTRIYQIMRGTWENRIYVCSLHQGADNSEKKKSFIVLVDALHLPEFLHLL